MKRSPRARFRSGGIFGKIALMWEHRLYNRGRYFHVSRELAGSRITHARKRPETRFHAHAFMQHCARYRCVWAYDISTRSSCRCVARCARGASGPRDTVVSESYSLRPSSLLPFLSLTCSIGMTYDYKSSSSSTVASANKNC